MKNYYLTQFRRDLVNVEFIPVRLYGSGELVRFFGGENWSNCKNDLNMIADQNRPNFIYSLFITVLSDQSFYTYFNEQYSEINSLLQYPKFGYHGLGPHNSNPFSILERPIELGVVSYEQLMDLVKIAAKLFVDEVKDFQTRHYNRFDSRKFFDMILNDQHVLNRDSEISKAFVIELRAVLETNN